MSRRFKTILLIAIIILITTFAPAGYDNTSKDKKGRREEDLYNQVELFGGAISVIRNDYVDEVDSKKLIYGAMKGMLSSLDDFSQFMEPDEYKEIRLETKGEFGGIGIEISIKDGILTIIAPIAGTPAEAAGIKCGDKIVKINGKTTKEMTLNDSVKLLRGEPGTIVTLTVWREKDKKILDIPIKRAIIKIASVKKAESVEDKIGYIKLIEFQENTPRDLEDALKRLEAAGIDSLILDLRNNPGGLLDIAIDVAEKFLAKDATIVSIKSRMPDQNAVFKSKGAFRRPSYPMIVLVNEGSASGSEIVAGAIQDNKRGIILGMKTFGKASVQTVIPLKDGSALKLTTASYFTPNGRMIRNQGIVPDVIVEKDEPADKAKDEKEEIFEKLEEKKDLLKKAERDSQLERALDLIKAIKVYKTIEQKPE